MPFARIKPYGIAVLVFFLVKLALLASLIRHDPAAFVMGDGFEYLTRADTMAQTGKFGILGKDGTVTDDAYRLPGYPAFLSLLRFSDGPERVAVWSIAQVVICHAWLLLVGGWMARRHGDRSATYFVVALSLTLPWTHYTAVVHSDFLFAVLLFSGALHLATALERRENRSVQTLAAALFLGAAALTRPDLVFLPFWLPAVALAWNMRPGRSLGRMAVIPVALAAVGTFGSMAAWAVRNYVVAGRLTYTSVVDTVVMFFASSANKTEAVAVKGAGMLDVVGLMVSNAMNIVLGFGPALAQVFFNPSRWYLHFYMRGWGLDLPSSGVPISEVGYSRLPPVEYVYMAVEILIPLAVFAVFVRFLQALWKGRISAPAPVMALLGAIMAYLMIQKGIWGALTVGSGQRYGMPILPFVVYFGALTFAGLRPAAGGGQQVP